MSAGMIGYGPRMAWMPWQGGGGAAKAPSWDAYMPASGKPADAGGPGITNGTTQWNAGGVNIQPGMVGYGAMTPGFSGQDGAPLTQDGVNMPTASDAHPQNQMFIGANDMPGDPTSGGAYAQFNSPGVAPAAKGPGAMNALQSALAYFGL